MSTPRPVPRTSGAGNPLVEEAPADGDQGVGGSHVLGEFSSSDAEMGTESPGQGRL
jgi:hypothetical protein